jgi:hypothetical protein
MKKGAATLAYRLGCSALGWKGIEFRLLSGRGAGLGRLEDDLRAGAAEVDGAELVAGGFKSSLGVLAGAVLHAGRNLDGLLAHGENGQVVLNRNLVVAGLQLRIAGPCVGGNRDLVSRCRAGNAECERDETERQLKEFHSIVSSLQLK